VDFSNSKACSQDTVFFKSDIQTFNDPITKKRWSFITQNKILDGDTVPMIFKNAGLQTIQLTASTKNGCSSSVLKTVNITPKPQSSFILNKYNAATNAEIQTSNTSLGAEDFIWTTDDNYFTIDKQNPIITFADSGVYQLQLIAFNNLGCSDTAKAFVKIGNISENLVVSNLQTTNTNGTVELWIDVNNLSFLETEDVEVKIDFGGTLEQNLVIQELIANNKKTTVKLPSSISQSQLQNLDYICVYHQNSGSSKMDTSCISYVQKISDLKISPLPADQKVWIEYYLPKSQEVDIELFDENGKILFFTEIPSSMAGKQKIEIDLSNLVPNLIYAKISTEDTTFVQKIIKN
jgi:hypothetical protein